MPKTVKKAKRKSSARNNIPPLKHPDVICDRRRPLPFEVFASWSERLVQLWADIDEWKKQCKKAFAEGKSVKDLPVFPVSKIPNMNAGRWSRVTKEKAVDANNEALEAGKTPPGYPPTYSPVEQEMISAIGCTVLRQGQLPEKPKDWDDKKQGLWKESAGKPGGIKAPKGWDDKKYGSWFHLDENGERTIPSRWVIDSSAQRGCHQSVDKQVENPSDNIVTLGGVRYVIGAGSKASDAALYQIDCSERGNYGAIWDVRRRLGMAKSKGIANLVWRIEDRPNEGACVKIDMGGGNFNFFMPGQSATPGYLTNGDGKELTAAQIRKAVEEETKGIKFKVLKDPIVSETITLDDAFPEIKKAYRQSKRENTERNACVQCRVHHDEGFAFGFRGASVGIVPFYRWSFDGSKYHLSIGQVVGLRQNADYNVGKQESKLAYYEANPKEEKPAAKPKAEKPKAEKKPAKPKAEKKAAKPKAEKKPAKPVSDPAPIVADTEENETADVAALDETQRDFSDAEMAAAQDD